jgi:thioredoxin reductase (NADPH)
LKLEPLPSVREVIIVGGGIAGLSAAIYLGRAQRDTLLLDTGKSMARWEPDVQNYLGFPNGVEGEELLGRGRKQAVRYGVEIKQDEIVDARREADCFRAIGKVANYLARRLLVATGVFHLPPQLEGVDECLGHSMFFCKDCDGFRVQGKRILIYGWNNETADYALAMLLYSSAVGIVTDGRKPSWDRKHRAWLREHHIPVYLQPVVQLTRDGSQIRSLVMEDATTVEVDALFTTRGDVYLNKIGKALGARLDKEGQIEVNACMRTSVNRLYAAGCVTPANCQMIIAAGEGAKAAQAINRDMFEESLARHTLKRFRHAQLADGRSNRLVRTKRSKLT